MWYETILFGVFCSIAYGVFIIEREIKQIRVMLQKKLSSN